jgi:hypothetical protein
LKALDIDRGANITPYQMLVATGKTMLRTYYLAGVQ